MTKLYVREYVEPPVHLGGLLPMASEPGVADQVVDYNAGVASSSAFNAKTRFVRVHTDAICSILFGTAPTALTTSARMAAGQTEYFEVPKGQSYKVSAITNT